MKTLDEVITAYEICIVDNDGTCKGCPYSDENGEPICIGDDKEDGLHYLKEYKERKEALRYWNEKAISEQQNIADAYMFYKTEKEKDNPPLTWDELKQMEGKPVWVEAESLSVGVSPYWKDWYIIKSFSDDEFMRCNDWYEWAKEMQGRLWQAYRKERE